jgi:hypothetical protein
MPHHISFRAIPWFSALFIAFLSPALAKSPDAGAKKNQAHLRLICVSSLPENKEVVLASRNAEGKWQELATTVLRNSLITDWLPAQAGELHLAVREDGTLKSICQFTYPAASHRALAVLVADPEQNSYEARLVDPKKSKFVEGSVLVINFSEHPGLVFLGPTEERVEAGQQRAVKPTLDDNGSYRMMVSYLDADGETVSCYDRQAFGDPKSREMLFLLPDKTLGLRVLGLPFFGSID